MCKHGQLLIRLWLNRFKPPATPQKPSASVHSSSTNQNHSKCKWERNLQNKPHLTLLSVSRGDRAQLPKLHLSLWKPLPILFTGPFKGVSKPVVCWTNWTKRQMLASKRFWLLPTNLCGIFSKLQEPTTRVWKCLTHVRLARPLWSLGASRRKPIDSLVNFSQLFNFIPSPRWVLFLGDHTQSWQLFAVVSPSPDPSLFLIKREKEKKKSATCLACRNHQVGVPHRCKRGGRGFCCDKSWSSSLSVQHPEVLVPQSASLPC